MSISPGSVKSNLNDKKLGDQKSDYDVVITPPDGGYGWVVVASSFLLQAIGGGIAFSFGVFFVEFLSTFSQGSGTTAWIGSLNTGLLFGAGECIKIVLASRSHSSVAILIPFKHSG